MFHDDLSRYAGAADEVFGDLTDGMRFVRFRPAYDRLNVGWLDGSRPWPAGEAPAGFTRRLLEIVDAQRVNQVLGLHECGLCPASLPAADPWYVPRPGQLCPSAGTGEIRVPGPPGTAFAAPQLLGHYVADHGYLPPRPFVEAVLAFDPRGPWTARFPGIRFPWIPADAVLRHVDDEG
ncbi:hypothetical protein [Streptomyces sp. UH6]|uniref:DUF7919 family protein n=1 Tax=Streptomyces sp. UH6 TaxID=2748379 RepID=UPI0015D47E85|nr:hypothetical protein [Streptomyces sp. UH6]NYV74715.1 hypothetical protein [Streptomyces sp. UH6]